MSNGSTGTRRVVVTFADDGLRESYERLKKEDDKLYKAITRVLDSLRSNPAFGVSIAKNLIPAYYVRRYGVNNLHKCNLPGGWRLLYFVKGTQAEVVSIVLEWLTHKKYERRFGY
ncbi:MAG: hypothetical protein NT016_00570 [Candidatus Aenigmarchaeota archaeon]|nr:hypothetical protein [Candidatus Aenigmarchaeota archaeon]